MYRRQVGPRPIKHRQPFYWWLLATDEETGKRYLDGEYYSESEANRANMEKFQGLAETYKLPTCNEAAAKGMLKSQLLGQSGNISDSMKPISYM